MVPFVVTLHLARTVSLPLSKVDHKLPRDLPLALVLTIIIQNIFVIYCNDWLSFEV